MIHPPGFAGAVFGTAESGDLRSDGIRREQIAAALGISGDWSFVHQVHGSTILEAHAAGNLGDADAIFVRRPGLPIAVATADCVPIIIEAVGAVAVVHAGWRGAAAGVVPAALSALAAAGCQPQRAAIGPAIGPCCYEVGQEVTEQFAGYAAETTWGSPSVDIPSFVAAQLAGLELWKSPECTFTSARLNSWRRDATDRRQVAVAWLPMN